MSPKWRDLSTKADGMLLTDVDGVANVSMDRVRLPAGTKRRVIHFLPRFEQSDCSRCSSQRLH